MIDYEYRSGHLAADPELRYTPSGTPVVNFTLIQSSKYYDQQQATWVTSARSVVDVVLWDKKFDNGDVIPWTAWATEVLRKGSHVVVHGRLLQRSWQNQQGENRYKTELRAESVFASLAEVATSDAPPNAGMGGGAASAPGAPPF
ncbi:TPA: single-stranded DNA-binding protein [Corynebacterium striatum]|nr:single-stranded DNA-binding protein [Corynebacterium striatum]